MASPASDADLAGEHLAAREGAALVDLRSRGVLEVSGPQRQKFLQGMLSNDVAGLRAGEGREAAFMNAKGAVQALLRVLAEENAIALETTAERLPRLQRSLEHYRVAAPVRFARRPVSVLAAIGPRAAPLLETLGVVLPPDAPDAHVAATVGGVAVRVVRAADLPAVGFVLHVPLAAGAAVAQDLRHAGAVPIGDATVDALRVEALRPWYGSDVGEDNLLHETGLLGECHSPTKGCYLGQEIVARLTGRGGHVSRALRGLRLSRPAHRGSAITDEQGKEVGRVTTAAVSPRLGPIALGYVHRTRIAAGTPVLVDGAPATVVERFSPGP